MRRQGTRIKTQLSAAAFDGRRLVANDLLDRAHELAATT
jgi:hypothetical protein